LSSWLDHGQRARAVEAVGVAVLQSLMLMDRPLRHSQQTLSGSHEPRLVPIASNQDLLAEVRIHYGVREGIVAVKAEPSGRPLAGLDSDCPQRLSVVRCTRSLRSRT